MKMFGVEGPRIITDKTMSGKVLMLPPDWLPKKDETEKAWIARIGPKAAVIINARPDLARAVAAQGVQLGGGDLSVPDARRVLGAGWIGRSVHGVAEAHEAIDEGADYLLLGAIFETASHPGQAGLGLDVLAEVAALGTRVIAIGGMTPARATDVREAGAWGVAAIRALWHAADSYAAAMELLTPWSSGT